MATMNISTADLQSQAIAALRQWGPVISTAEHAAGLPAGLLLAVGSRETNLRDEFGDAAPRNAAQWGHAEGPYPGGCWAVGVWQRDAGGQWADYDPTLLNDIPRQAALAAAELAAGIAHFGDLHAGVAAYNAGIGGAEQGLANHGDPDYWTTGKDYGADVLARLSWLTANHLVPASPTPAPIPAPVLEDDMEMLYKASDQKASPSVVYVNGPIAIVCADTAGFAGVPVKVVSPANMNRIVAVATADAK